MIYFTLALLASIPAAYTWWHGRRVRAMPDDQLLPERLVEERKRSSYVLLPTSVVIALVGGWHLLWTVPLTLVLLLAADFPARRHIYGEAWSLSQYLRFCCRWSLAFGGFWLLLGLTACPRRVRRSFPRTSRGSCRRLDRTAARW